MLMQKKKKLFTDNLNISDPELFSVIEKENNRQEQEIELIASENITSLAVMQAQGSVMTNKYAEGYPGRRYYGGCEYVDMAEDLAIERIKKLFNCKFANVQPNSGSQANQAVFMSLMKPGDTFLAMDLASGGHLTHGAKPNLSGKWFNAIHYGVNRETEIIDYSQVEELAKLHKPKVMIWISLLKSGLVAGKGYPFFLVIMPHVVDMQTTHKVFRSARGGIILTNHEDLAKKFNTAVFPGYQGGPLMHVIAAKAVAFGEALKPDFKIYQKNVIENAKILSKTLEERGFRIVTGGTDTHVVLVDVGSKNIKGNEAEKSLGKANITCNKNGIPFDTEKPMVTSGIRLGTPAGTTRGFGSSDFINIGNWIADVLEGLQINGIENNQKAEVSN